MNPSTRFLVLGVTLVLTFTALSAAGVVWQAKRLAQNDLRGRLQLAATVEGDLQASRQQELQLRSEALAHDPAFVDYVAQSLIPNPQLGGAIDSASISDLLTERRQGYDVALVLDPQGKPVALSGILLKDNGSILSDPLIVQALSTNKAVHGAWVNHGKLFWVAINPLLRGGATQGYLVTATQVNNAFATSVSRIARTGIAFLIERTPDSGPAPSSGLDAWAAQALSNHLNDALGVSTKTGQMLSMIDDQHVTTTWVTPLETSGGRAALVALDQNVGADGFMDASVQPLLLGVGILGVVGMLVVLLLWWRTWLPLQRMRYVIQRASAGDDHMTLRVEGSPIVRYLRDDINRLVHAIRTPLK